MTISYEQIKIQIEIVEIHNQQIGSLELMNTLHPKKTYAKKLHNARTDARNATQILKNMIRVFAEGR